MIRRARSRSSTRLAPDAFTRMVRRADLRSAATVVRVVARWAPDLDEDGRAEAGRIAERLIQLAAEAPRASSSPRDAQTIHHPACPEPGGSDESH